jgi:hypothetical protein
MAFAVKNEIDILIMHLSMSICRAGSPHGRRETPRTLTKETCPIPRILIGHPNPGWGRLIKRK